MSRVYTAWEIHPALAQLPGQRDLFEVALVVELIPIAETPAVNTGPPLPNPVGKQLYRLLKVRSAGNLFVGDARQLGNMWCNRGRSAAGPPD